MDEVFEDQQITHLRSKESGETPNEGTFDEGLSPRGVLEMPFSGHDSDHCSTDKVSTWDINYANLHWKKVFGQIKKKSSMKFSTIPFLGGYGYDLSKKTFKRKYFRNHSTEDASSIGTKMPWRSFAYDELKQATDNFSPGKLIGKGGQAEVYKGLLADGTVVAVKKVIKQRKNDEENRAGDFLSELGIIAHIDHPNTAKLLGFSADKGLLHLVLQFSPHGSLDTALHGADERIMDWKKRYRVAAGIAEGLKYLHSDCHRRIIHRDITASNILLSEDYEAQISDFGLAKWLPDKWQHHVVSPIEGTFGYMAPEYFMHGVVHEKTDVFAFGVLLLELITGRRAVDSYRQSLVMWAKPLLEKNGVKEIADPRLGEDYDVAEMKRASFVAKICIHHLPTMRPSMDRVVKLLRGEAEAASSEVKQKSMGMKALIWWDSCDMEDYTSNAYQKDLNRHMELLME